MSNCGCEETKAIECNEDGILLKDLTSDKIDKDWIIYAEKPDNNCEYTGHKVKIEDLFKLNELSLPWKSYIPMDYDSDNGCWLLANGRTVTYRNLDTGEVDVVKIGDIRGRTIVMPDSNDALKTSITVPNKKYGWAKSDLQINQMPNHNHGLNDPGHAHRVALPLDVDGQIGTELPNFETDSNKRGFPHNFTSTSDLTGITIQATGGGQAHNNMQPSIGKNVFWNSCRKGYEITNISSIPTLTVLTNANFNENNLTDPNA